MTAAPRVDLDVVVGAALDGGRNILGVRRVHDRGGLPIESEKRQRADTI